MTPDASWLQGLAITALPILGFLLGARWMRYRYREGVSVDRESTTSRSGDGYDHANALLDSVKAQVDELAERQDFAERLLMQRRERERSDDRVNTPV